MVCFQQQYGLAVKSITGGAAGSSSTLQPLFYGADTAVAAVLPSVMAPTSTTLGESHTDGHTCGRGGGGGLHIGASVCARVCFQAYVSTCASQCCD